MDFDISQPFMNTRMLFLFKYSAMPLPLIRNEVVLSLYHEQFLKITFIELRPVPVPNLFPLSTYLFGSCRTFYVYSL